MPVLKTLFKVIFLFTNLWITDYIYNLVIPTNTTEVTEQFP